MRLGTSFPSRLDAPRAWAYLSDFGSIEEWDPLGGDRALAGVRRRLNELAAESSP